MLAPIIGKDCLLYIEDVLCNNVKDLTWKREHEEADATTREAAGFGMTVATQNNLSIEWDMVSDISDTAYLAVMAAAAEIGAANALKIKVLNSLTGEGFEGDCMISVTEPQPVAGLLITSVVAKPTLGANAPTWLSGGS